MGSPLDFDLGGAIPNGVAAQRVVAPAGNLSPASPLDFDLSASGKNAPPTAAQQASALWKQTPGWQKPFLFVSQGIDDVGTGLDHLLGIKTNGPVPKANYGRYAAPPGTNKQASPAVWNALDAQHPGYNYLVKWPTEFAVSAPGGEAAGGLVDAGASRLLPKLPEGESLLMRGLYRLPGAMARGAAYGVQQPGGSPGTNAAVGAAVGPLFEGGASIAGKALGSTAEGIQGLWRKFFPRELSQPEIDSVLARHFAERGYPSSVTPKPTVPNVELPTAVHSGDPNLMAGQAAHRLSGNGVPFYELARDNNVAIVNGLRQRFAPQTESQSVSAAAHQLLQNAQAAGRSAVSEAYKPFDAVKGGVYLDRGPTEAELREAYEGLLPAHREIMPAKLQEIIGKEQPIQKAIAPQNPQQMLDSERPLHLKNDIEDLSARLSDEISKAQPHSPASRALMIMRDALNRGVEASKPVVGAGADPVEQANELWTNAKAANKAFRDRFPQGTARDSEARQWLSRWLGGGRDPTKFLTEATAFPARAKSVLDALSDRPEDQEQMRRLLQNHYVNRLLRTTREGIPGAQTLSAESLSKARDTALESSLFRPDERGTLDRYVQAAHDNQKILQRLHSGSSETAALRNLGKEGQTSVTEELLKHGASHLHPVAGLLAHLLPALAKSPDNEAALQRTLTSALMDPTIYNRVASAPTQIESPLEKLLRGLGRPTELAATRPLLFGVPRGLGPQISGAR